MLVPTCASELTLDWFSKVLNLKIIQDSFKLKENVHGGIGFMSSMAKVQFDTTEPNKESYSLIIKLLPQEGEFKELTLVDHLDQMEIKTYQSLLPELIKILPELEEYICPVLYAEIQEETSECPYSSVAVMKDLSPGQYKMLSFDQHIGLDLNQSNSYISHALDFLAKLHAASDGVQKKLGGKLPEFFDWLKPYLIQIEGAQIPQCHSLVPQGFPCLFKILEENAQISNPDLRSAYKALEPKASNILLKILEAGAFSKYATAIHGDLWPHNVLVRKDQDLIINMKIIDWQWAGYTDPCFDLGTLIITSLDLGDLNKENIMKAAKFYYSTYEHLTRDKLGIVPNRSYEEFEEYFLTFGLGYTLVWMITACVYFRDIPAYAPKLCKGFEVLFELGIPQFLGKYLD